MPVLSPAEETDSSLCLRAMEPGDVAHVSELAGRIWRAHYVPIIGEAQTEFMLGELFSAAALTETLNTKNLRFLLAADNEAIAGFISWREESASQRFIDKFYVDAAVRRAGIGNALLTQACDLPEGEIRLRVNRYNIGAINYYFRRGFTIESVIDSAFGPYTLDDYTMVKTIKNHTS